jgi:Chaperone of endosialidase
MDQENVQIDSTDAKKRYEKVGVEEMSTLVAPGLGGSQMPLAVKSDRNMKENFIAVDVHDVLEKLSWVHISKWNYKADSDDVRHIGPMAQDFAKAFCVGDSDRAIHNVDSNGVALAAIQALHHMVLEQNERIAALSTEVRELRHSATAV